MPPSLTLLFGSLFGGLIIWLAMSSRDKWKKGRGMMGKPAKQAEENKKKMEAAQADRTKGWAEVRGALLRFGLMVLVIFLLVYFVTAIGRLTF